MNRQFLFCSFFFIVCNLHWINSQPYCNANYLCNQCQFCGQDNMNYDDCFYYQIFCKKNRTNLIYSPNLKNEYIDYFSLDYETMSFCGTEEFNIKNIEPTNNEILIFSTEKKYQNFGNIHCHFLINLEKSYLLYPNMIITNYPSNNGYYSNRDLDYYISYIYTYNNQVRSQKSNSLSSFDINYSHTIDISTAITLEIFVDFFKDYLENPKNILEIKISFERKLSVDEVTKDDSSTSNKVALGTGIGGGVVVFWVIVCCCYKHCCEKKN